MSKDSQFSYVHLKDSHHVLYMSNWIHDRLPFDSVDILNANFEQDNYEDSSTLINPTFGSLKSHKKNNEAPKWKDFNLQKFLIDDYNTNNKNDDDHAVDHGDDFIDDTILKKIDMSNQFNQNADSSDFNNSSFFNFDSTSSFSPDSSILNNSNASSSSNTLPPHIELSTPNVMRDRSAQRNHQNYQTPVGRIIR